MKVFVQCDKNGIPSNQNLYTAYLGFLERSAEVVPFTIEQMDDLELTRQAPVAGSIFAVRHAWRTLGVPLPAPLGYPESLLRFAHRRIWRTTYEEIYDQLHAEGFTKPIFIKPADIGKAFTGKVIREHRDLIEVAHLDPSFALWASEVVDFASEWRVFVVNNTIVDARPYKGDSFRAPDRVLVEEMIARYSAYEAIHGGAPTAYSLDMGALVPYGETALIELNDGYSLGAYGLHPTKYASLLAHRWFEACELPLPPGW
jgi:hypothetical protein